MVDQLLGVFFFDGLVEFLYVLNLCKLVVCLICYVNVYIGSLFCVLGCVSFMLGQLLCCMWVYDNVVEFVSDILIYVYYLCCVGYQICLLGKMYFVGFDQLYGYEECLIIDIYFVDFGWMLDYCKLGEWIDWWYYNLGSVIGVGVVEISNQYEYDDEVVYNVMCKFYDLVCGGDDWLWCLIVSFIYLYDFYVVWCKYWDLYDGILEIELFEIMFYDDMDLYFQCLMDVCDWCGLMVIFDYICRVCQGYFVNISYIDDKLGELMDVLEWMW